MEENNVTTGKIGMRFGIIAGIAGIAFFMILNLLGQGTNQTLSYLGYLILAAIMFLGHKAYKEEGDSYMNYAQGLGIGTLIALISGALNAIFFYIYVSFINTGYMGEIMNIQREKMEEQGLGDDQIEQAMEMTERFMSPGLMAVFAIVGSVFFGFIISLIISAITQNKRPENNLV